MTILRSAIEPSVCRKGKTMAIQTSFLPGLSPSDPANLFPQSGTSLTGERELELAARLDRLHQLLYTRGGIRPVNAAVEELSKLVLLRIAADRFPHLKVAPGQSLADLLDQDSVKQMTDPGPIKQAFARVITVPELCGRLPDGTTQSVWPQDEPLRLTRYDVLIEALEIVNSLEFSQGNRMLDPLGVAFDVFLQGRYDHSGGLATYLTPATVATSMARICLSMVDPLDGWNGSPVAGDPCCGTGRFLVAILEELRLKLEDQAEEDQYVRFRDSGVMGADQSSSAVAKARVNLLSLGARRPQVFTVEDSITDHSVDSLRGKMRLLLTNPPFGEGKYDSAEGIRRTAVRFPRAFARARIDPSLAFVARCLDLLTEGGILGIILPDGVVDGADMRVALASQSRELARDVSVEASISLPSATFSLAGTTAKTSALFLRRGRASNRRVWMARAEHIGYLKQGSGPATDPKGDDLPRITSVLLLAAHDVTESTEVLCEEPLVAAVDHASLRSLTAGSLDAVALRARDELARAGGVELSTLVSPVTRRVRARGPGIPFVSVLHVDDLGAVDWMQAEAYRPSTPGLVAEQGELIVSLLNPSKLRAAVIPDLYKRIECSAEFGIYACRANPYGVLSLLENPLVKAQLAPMGRGTSSSRRRIDVDDLLGVLVPYREPEDIEKTGQAVQRWLEQLDTARRKLDSIYACNSVETVHRP